MPEQGPLRDPDIESISLEREEKETMQSRILQKPNSSCNIRTESIILTFLFFCFYFSLCIITSILQKSSNLFWNLMILFLMSSVCSVLTPYRIILRTTSAHREEHGIISAFLFFILFIYLFFLEIRLLRFPVHIIVMINKFAIPAEFKFINHNDVSCYQCCSFCIFYYWLV